MNIIKLQALLQSFFLEDFGEGDLTSQALFSEEDHAEGIFTAKADGVFSGLDVLHQGYLLANPSIQIRPMVKDGERIKKGQDLFWVSGPVQALLSRERVLLNLVQRMSGIATQTRQAVDTLCSDHTKITDTRKTVPGLRMLDKYAVTTGGGSNHRFGLYDGVMIKDNHIEHCGSIRAAVEIAKSRLGHMAKIEVETECKAQVLEAVHAGVDVIMFDNRTPEEVREFVPLVPDHIVTEASGGISLDNLHAYSDTGVDYISLGYLTHSVTALDISFNLIKGSVNHEYIGNDPHLTSAP
ncbi:nicotinate-nucleotide diphosphorylase (carboxylating) [Pullulanibacillus camelliae]|uniref:Probable nicotinate-nucleotide pyrophosphorylase [carboxylating] n=1 Tax=Pullulanibacillus camelliae TaxID=1707096 RepID=A0A8J2VLC6_9BACL|nr:carboxylating nicotinate-nucleotide diphosphorylase [Pullulanibacillus camelliae]GGE30604.1 nicotinate-nucleotide diphosphorylase (carboxylating) [Pullulanibacillus camelliae]